MRFVCLPSISMLICAAICLVALPDPASAQTENRYDPYGSPGDAGVDLRCAPGSYVVGMSGASGTNIDRIQLICAKLGSNGLALPTTETTATYGGAGGGANGGTCSAGTYVNRVNVWLTLTKAQVYFLMVDCTRPGGAGPSGFNFGAPYKPADGLFSPYPTRNYLCLPNMAVSGLTVRYGKHINAIGVICSTIVVPTAPPAPPPPAPPHHTGTIIVLGKPKDGSPAPVVTYPSFVGRYNLTSRSGRTMVFVINAGDGNDLFGTLTSSDPRFNGTFTGTASSGRKFKFTYRDAGTGMTGSGTITYNGQAGDAIIGGITSDGPPLFGEVWGGKRQ